MSVGKIDTSQVQKVPIFDFASLYPHTQKVILIKPLIRREKIRKIFRSQV
jgi:hypothetical protein